MQSFGILTWATKETLRDEYSYRYDAPIKEEEGQRNETLQHVAVLHWYFLSQAPLEGYFWKQMSSASPYLLFLASGWPVNLVRFILCVCAQLCPTLCSPMDHQAPLSMEFWGKNTGAGCHFLLQGIFLTQESLLYLLHCRWIIYHW